MDHRVFISSTVYDLLDIRAELEKTLLEMGLTPIMSDRSSSEFSICPDENSIESCLVNLKSCNTVIIILSQRYGPSLKEVGYDDISATHLEYREAKKQKIPIFFYVRDRLEADYRIWRKNNRDEKTKLAWIKRRDKNLLEFIDEHQELIKDADTSNWYSTFCDSCELKKIICRDLKIPAGKISLNRAIKTNQIPLINVSTKVDLMTVRNPSLCLACTIKNVGTMPAFNLKWIWEKKGIREPDDEKYPPMAVMAPQQETHASLIYCLLPGEASIQNNLCITYQTAEGHFVEDTFLITGAVRSDAHLGGAWPVSKIFRIGENLLFDIQTDKLV